MTAPIDLQRSVVIARARKRGVPLVTPDSPSALREAAALLITATSERTNAGGYDQHARLRAGLGRGAGAGKLIDGRV